jgi:hypothetical protein
MRKSEQAMWSSSVKPVLDRLGSKVAYARHECKVTPGTADLDYASKDHGGWIELKRVAAPRRPTSKLPIRHLTSQQVEFLQSRGRLGQQNWVLVQVDDDLPVGRPPSRKFYLWHHTMLEHLEAPGVLYTDWPYLATIVWDGAIPTKSLGTMLGADI